MQLKMEEVPTDVRRRVAQLLENVRGTDMDPTDGRAALTGEVTAVHRPDIDGIAYYEFAVDLGRGKEFRFSTTQKETADHARLPARHGFVLAAAQGHDHPVAHWSLDREPPSHQIAMAAEKEGARVERVFKLDALAYVGESPDGEMVGQTGQLPLPISGLPEDPAEARGQISSTLAQPAEASRDDEKPSDKPHELIRRGAKPRKVKIEEVGSWQELREVYGKTFGPLLKDLAFQAAPAWQVEKYVEEFGEGVFTGTTHKVALLEADAVVDVSGDGAGLVELRRVETPQGAGAIELHVADKPLDREMPFDLDIVYRSGLHEQLRFFAVSPTTRSDRRDEGGLSVFEEE